MAEEITLIEAAVVVGVADIISRSSLHKAAMGNRVAFSPHSSNKAAIASRALSCLLKVSPHEIHWTILHLRQIYQFPCTYTPAYTLFSLQFHGRFLLQLFFPLVSRTSIRATHLSHWSRYVYLRVCTSWRTSAAGSDPDVQLRSVLSAAAAAAADAADTAATGNVIFYPLLALLLPLFHMFSLFSRYFFDTILNCFSH